MSRPRVLLVAATTGYQTQMFAEAAAHLELDLLLATDRCHVLNDPWGDRALPIRFDDPDAAAAIVAEAGPIDGLVALGDRPALVAAGIAARLGMTYNAADAVAACRNKYLARQRLRAAGLPVPEFFRLALDQDLAAAASSAPYPCVLKPLGLSASRGVIRADSPGQFVAAFQRIRSLLEQAELGRTREEQDEYIQVERFIPGCEFALEGILDNGRLHILAVFDKPDPLDGPYFEETIYVTPSRQSEEVQHEMALATAQALEALGLRHGPVHAEMRVNEAGVWILEIAARPIGGLCAKVLPGLPELILRHAAGQGITKLASGRRAAGVLMLPIPREGVYQGVVGSEQAGAVQGIEDVIITAKQGQKLIPLPEGNSYLGFVFARGDAPEEVEAALRSAHAALQFEVTGALPVMAR